MTKLHKNILALVAALTTVIASVVASSACYWCMYQPKEPKALKED